MANNITNRFAAYCFAFVSVAVSIVILIFLRPYFLPFVSVFVAAIIAQMSCVSLNIDTGNHGRFEFGPPHLGNIVLAIDHIRKDLPDYKFECGHEARSFDFERSVYPILDEYSRMSNGVSQYTESYKRYEHFNKVSDPIEINMIFMYPLLCVFLYVYCQRRDIPFVDSKLTTVLFIIVCFSIYALIRLLVHKFITSGMDYNEPEIPEENQTPASLDWSNSSADEILKWFENERFRIWPVLNPRMEWLSKWPSYERNVTISRTVYLTIIVFLTILIYYGSR